jgi:hypothetical protein
MALHISCFFIEAENRSQAALKFRSKLMPHMDTVFGVHVWHRRRICSGCKQRASHRMTDVLVMGSRHSVI